MQPSTRPRTSSSVSGYSTTNGYSTRQSVASVTCDTRARPSNAMLSVSRVAREHAHARACAGPRSSRNDVGEAIDRRARRVDAACATLASRSGDRARRVRRAALVDLAQPVAQRVDQQRCRFGLSSRSSCRYGLRSTTQMSPSTSNSMRAERPVRRSPRSSVEQLPHRRAEQPDHDLAIRERRVVVRDLAQAGRFRARILPRGNRFA